MSKYDITVLTLISQGKLPRLTDQITFYGVGEGVKTCIADSCKTTLGWLMKLSRINDYLP